jgi:thymidylate synthase (FAD)
MNVKLVSYSKPSLEFEQDGLENAQDLIAFCARVSNPNNQMNTETSEKLINYLVKHKHWSPLEMVSACLEIETTRDIAHQIVRHRSFAFQEFSQRYANPIEDLSFASREFRLQDTKNRQNSIDLSESEMPEQERLELENQWRIRQDKVVLESVKQYKWALKNGIAKEQARVVLPEGLTKTRLYMNGSLRSWVHYVELRGANGTQKEHMEIAHACAKVIAEIFPLIQGYITDPG